MARALDFEKVTAEMLSFTAAAKEKVMLTSLLFEIYRSRGTSIDEM